MEIESNVVKLDQWRNIEEEDDTDLIDQPLNRERLLRLKEQWFSDAFSFLISLPSDTHVWCGNSDLMGPLLEPYYNYFKDDSDDNKSPLKVLYFRFTGEMRQCTQCICKYHQAQETYYSEYDYSSVSALLEVLRTLDEERVSNLRTEINSRLAHGQYDARCQAEVVCVMFEVLMFPYLLDDRSLAANFETFIEAIDDYHELTLTGHQQYPGVYALLFLKSRRARSIGFRLAGVMGKLRLVDLAPLQPLLKKCISFLESDMIPSVELPRPRVQLDRITVWLGIKALLGFLEAPAFEEGILDKYPVFLSIVLNHISDDSAEFSYAVNCLRLLFEMLGCKLWLRSTLSPNVMRNTLIGQCFHTRNEKIHKEIFELLLPFLQSLEALPDGEHEKQRRHFLYFLLHQVTSSSNFSSLMRKKACQIALQIIHRGYKMTPPFPPYECAHMWGPSLVSSLKDSSLHTSLRQPAFDLIQSIIVSDASVLVASVLNNPLGGGIVPSDGLDEESVIEENDASCWNEFYLQSRRTVLVYGEWMCIPMLWFDVLVGIDPLVLPVSFSKSVLWAISRFSMVEPDNGTNVDPSSEKCPTTGASEISHLFGWKIPSGCDDGGCGTESKNSASVSKLYMPLIRTFRRFASHFIVKMENVEITKQWTWESMMADSLILLLFDPNDIDREVGRRILEKFSDKRGLTCSLQFLCSSQSSLAAVTIGLRHALKLVQLDLVLRNFQRLHHFFFVLSKLLKEGNSCTSSAAEASVLNLSKFSSEGGYLKHPYFDVKLDNMQSFVSSSAEWEKFSYLVSEIAWPALQKCLAEGKAFMDSSSSQMTCVRVLETFPIIFDRLYRHLGKVPKGLGDMDWLHDLVDLGRSSLAVVVRYWKKALASLVGLLKELCTDISASDVRSLEKLISCENFTADQLNDQVARLSVSLMGESGFTFKKTSKSETLSSGKTSNVGDAESEKSFSLKDAVGPLPQKSVEAGADNVITLSDDEEEPETVDSDKTQLHDGPRSSRNWSDFSTQKPDLPQRQTPHVKSKDTKTSGNEELPKEYGQGVSELTETSKDSDLIRSESGMSKRSLKVPQSSESIMYTGSKDQPNHEKILIKRQTATSEAVPYIQDDSWEFSFFKSGKLQGPPSSKQRSSGPKRQVIQLALPMENKSANFRVNGEVVRFKAPRLDDWYKLILELDFFATVGLVLPDNDEKRKAKNLKEVPVCFTSPVEYVEIFQPLVFEEFKAQLQSSFLEMASLEEMSCGSIAILSVECIDDFHIVRCVHEDDGPMRGHSCNENDLVLFTRQLLPSSSCETHMVGKVERRELDNKRKSSILVIRLYLKSGCSRINRARKFLVERSKWGISRLMSITPQLREFQALSSIREIPMLHAILNPTVIPFHGYSTKMGSFSELSLALKNVLQSSYNDSQLQAISAALGSFVSQKDFELSLIQGPPGTGKTRTIVGIISGLLAFSRKRDAKKPLNEPRSTGAVSLFQPKSNDTMIAKSWKDAAMARQLNEDRERNTRFLGSSSRGRILICAQSNAAVDELVSRITTEGLFGSDGLTYKPYLVRVGNAKTVHPNSLPFFIDTLVDQRLAEEKAISGRTETAGDSLSVLRSNLESLAEHIKFYEVMRNNLRDGSSVSRSTLEGEFVKKGELKELSLAEVDAKLVTLNDRKKATYKEIANLQAQERRYNEESKALKHKLRRTILKEAEIVVTTLSGCGGDLYGVCAESTLNHKFHSASESTLFDAVVIDEAAQALEPATLIPLQLLKSRGTRCIMVGDPKQLPATVLSNIATKYSFQCSMFERLQRAGYPVVMLNEQYRMHPEICKFPASHFYDGKLNNGSQMLNKTAAFHETKGLGPYVFFDIIDGQENHGKSSGSLSLFNEREADAAIEVLRFFKRRYPLEFVGVRVGVITPYKSQLSLMRSRFSHAFGSGIVSEIEFNTIDGFQGREVDILLLSTVRAAEPCSQSSRFSPCSIGFLADVRRMNVALTRAKLSLWIFGNARTLQTNENWTALLRDAKDRNLVIAGKRPYSSIFKTSNEAPATESRNYSRQQQNSEKVVAVDKHSDANRKRSRHERLRKKFSDADEHAEVEKNNGKDLKKRKCLDGVDADGKSEKHVSHSAAGVKGRNREVMGAAATENSDCQTSEGLNSMNRGSRAIKPRGSGSLRGEVQPDTGISGLNNGDTSGSARGNLKKVEEETQSRLKSASIQGCEGSKHEKRKLECEVASSRGASIGKSASEVERPKSKNMNRKQQRDAVEALLSSALISSRKPEPRKSVPSARTPSTSSRSHATNPQKTNIKKC